MQAHILPLGQPILPFGDQPADLPVLGESLAEVQRRAFEAVAPPPGLSWVIGDHTWVTQALLRRFAAAVGSDGGQFAMSGPLLEVTQPLQVLVNAGDAKRFPLALWPGQTPPTTADALTALPAIEIDLDITIGEPPSAHPVFQKAQQPIPMTEFAIHTIEHWSHLHRVNLLALVAWARSEQRRFDNAPWWSRVLEGLRVLWRAKSLNRFALATAISRIGSGCDIHPTATVEAAVLGDNVTIGPHAVVRGSWLGDGVVVGEHAQINRSIALEGAQLSRGVMLNFSLVLQGALVSPGFGHQASVFGRDSFVAYGATFYDLSFGGEIKVEHRGERVSSGSRFMGVAVGHRARIGPHVIVNYGESVPNDAFLVVDPGRIFRRIPSDLSERGAVAMKDGEITKVGG